VDAVEGLKAVRSASRKLMRETTVPAGCSKSSSSVPFQRTPLVSMCPAAT